MLNKIRNFAKTKIAGVFVGILIVPFVLWGMGGVFSSGNTNSVAKVNNENISTQDLMNFLNSSNIDQQTIRDNLENNVIEQLTSTLVSEKLLEMEINDLNLIISEKALANNIRNNPNFFDDNNKFSRIKYEKFLLSSDLTATEFEQRVKKNELQKKLFYYIGGGIKSPYFVINNTFKEQQSKINLEYLNLNNAYSNESDISNEEIDKFIIENSEELKEEYISFSYLKITPKNLIGTNEYNNEFFNKIDEIENEISNGISIKSIANNFDLNLIERKNYIKNNESDPIEKKIYEMKDTEIQLFDEGNFYIAYEINNTDKILPKKNDEKFRRKISKIFFKKKKYEFNKKILDEINKKKFTQSNFQEIIQKNSIKLEKIQLNSIEDKKIFSTNSVKLIYSLPQNSFTLVNDEDENIYLVKIVKINDENISKNSMEYKNYKNKGKNRLKDLMYSSYDNFLEDKYKVKINQKTIERVKNYFK